MTSQEPTPSEAEIKESEVLAPATPGAEALPSDPPEDETPE